MGAEPGGDGPVRGPAPTNLLPKENRQNMPPSQTVPARREAREEKQGALRQTCKTTSQEVPAAAERFWAVRGQTQPAEDRQNLWASVQTSPRTLGEFGPRGQIPPQRLFLFWTVHGPFSLFLRAEKEKMGGASAQPSSWQKSPRPQGRAKPPPLEKVSLYK